MISALKPPLQLQHVLPVLVMAALLLVVMFVFPEQYAVWTIIFSVALHLYLIALAVLVTEHLSFPIRLFACVIVPEKERTLNWIVQK